MPHPPEPPRSWSVSFGYQRLLVSLIGLQTAILLAGIPWAMSIHGAVKVVETQVSESLATRHELDALATRVAVLESKAGR